ncbi:hypothetical protein ml_69 [Mollivirus sibericum]|uniref:hypothetical protein n=1 Tax=Mollivirus sibericum TaxID=1678078 RepID=UPI0006B2E4CA|nr:hypothetical protein ml_69 [Mollivirus sibericum]ALD61871.1 hypothetical protein ml_69 [Mollivirus sibericum]
MNYLSGPEKGPEVASLDYLDSFAVIVGQSYGVCASTMAPASLIRHTLRKVACDTQHTRDTQATQNVN